MSVYILYRDIRTYGEREYALQVKPVRPGSSLSATNLENKPQVELVRRQSYGHVTDHVLGLPCSNGCGPADPGHGHCALTATKSWPSFSRCPSTKTAFSSKNTPNWDRANLPPTVCSSAAWPITPNPSTRPSPREKRAACRGPSRCWPRRTSLPAAKWLEIDPRCAPAAGYAYPSAPTPHQLHRGGCAHVRRPGNHQPGPVQGVRPVRGLLPLRRHSPQGIRQ
jgi:hypothetical protein